MTPDERRRLEALRELPMADPDEAFEDVNMQDILNGDQPLNISHAGGEFAALAETLGRDLWKALVGCHSIFQIYSPRCSQQHHIPRHFDGRTRRDRTEKRERAFDKQMDALTDSYMNWSLNTTDPTSAPAEVASAGSVVINIIGLYSKPSSLQHHDGRYLPIAKLLARQL